MNLSGRLGSRVAFICLVAGVGFQALACGREELKDECEANSGEDCDSSLGGSKGSDSSGETFQNPPILEPNQQGVYELEFKPTEFMLEGQRHCGRAYNGQYLGPTIETSAAKDGEKRQVRVNLKNRFSKDDYQGLGGEKCSCHDESSGTSCTPGHHHGGDGCVCVNEEGKTCHLFNFNLTNLHAHGSHVRPDFASGHDCSETDEYRCRSCNSDPNQGPRECFLSDDVLSRVAPGEGVQHRWDIDEDHVAYAGLNWFHPHIHGSTAIQVASGAAGAWIVRGPLDEIRGIKDAKERIIHLTTPPGNYAPLKDGEPCDEDHLTFQEFAPLEPGAPTQYNLVNGLRRPRMITPPGQIERWRILYASFLDDMIMALFKGKDDDCQELDLEQAPVALTQIARDGIVLNRPPDGNGWPYAPEYIFVSPGYRVEALLDGSELRDGETLCLMSARPLQVRDSSSTPEDPLAQPESLTETALLSAAAHGDVLLILNVKASAGTPTETEMPDLEEVASLAPSLQLKNGTVDALEECKAARAISAADELDQAVAFSNSARDCDLPEHNINGKNFESTDRAAYPYDRVLKVGEMEHWRLTSVVDTHPFHIHINPFLVCPLDPKDKESFVPSLLEPPFAHWRDTYLVGMKRKTDILSEYRAFSGDFVYHCHRLTHEDHGMMELVRICDPAVETCDNLCSEGSCDWKTCAPGDDNCERAASYTACVFDGDECAERRIRCDECSSQDQCRPDSYCGELPDAEGKLHCLPGCQSDEDCGLLEKCESGECKLAPCSTPCLPQKACRHGSCQ